MAEFDADPNTKNGKTHYDDTGSFVDAGKASNCIAVVVDGTHVNKTFKTPFDALDWAVAQPNCDGKSHVFFGREL